MIIFRLYLSEYTNVNLNKVLTSDKLQKTIRAILPSTSENIFQYSFFIRGFQLKMASLLNGDFS